MSVKSQISDYNNKYPWQAVTYKGKEFPYRYHQKGEITLVLLTGGIGKSDLFFLHFEAFVEAGYSVITFDYPYDFPTNAELAGAVNHLLEHLDAKHVFLVGQSYGGFLAQVIACKYPDAIEGLILSNTGSLFSEMEQDGKDSMMAMKARLEKTINLLRFVPMGILKPIMKRSIMKKLNKASNDEHKFMKEISDIMLSVLTVKHESHMCNLMIDLFNEFSLQKKDFEMFDESVLLLLSEDDGTFNESVKAALITSMSNPVIRTDIKGGHLALLLRIESYLEAVDEFLKSRANI